VNTSTVTVHELIAWGLDEYPDRSFHEVPGEENFAQKVTHAAHLVARRAHHEPVDAELHDQSSQIQQLLEVYAQRADMQSEYAELDWKLGVIDLHLLTAFQRRLVFDLERQVVPIPAQNDWNALFSLSFGSARNTDYTITSLRTTEACSEFIFHSTNPDLQLRPSEVRSSSPFSLYGGSPFFEAAEYRGQWFLRDGYHRAYHLLQAGVRYAPAVIIRARTIEEVGATQPWFFSEAELFSPHPPRVTDFLDCNLVLKYQRSRFIKMIRVRIEESLEPIREGDRL
jgi:hypothetical protein